ncbi:MAG: GTPase [Candidatus Diapherotrites archaeon]
MPTNVSVEYAAAQEKYEAAETMSEKLAALQEMRSTAPTHKGAEKMRAGISKKIALLKIQMEKQKEQAKKSGGGQSINVKKEGMGQIVIVGMPNSGKSFLLKRLTGVDVEIADYPFTTKKPEIGMINYNGGWIQLIEIPALIEGSSGGKANGIQLISLVRNADAVVFTIANNDEEKILLNELNRSNIKVNRSRPKIEIKVTDYKGITIAGKNNLKVTEDELKDFLKGMGYHKASVLLGEETTIEKVAEVLDSRIEYKKAVFVKRGDDENDEKLKERLFNMLGKILVYTKKPGGKADMDDPLVLKEGATVEDVAGNLHKDFARNLKYVKVWGSAKYPGQRVSRDYELKNGDIIEIYS